ncbi:MAG: hypothetical protein K2M60_02945 [Lachnospiraceae bacterium]|nr:hypothetical protein [Lachnospiraceae bacterium]MDE6252588.1 hypothetical protein [Lachnospiraceae bacterium]
MAEEYINGTEETTAQMNEEKNRVFTLFDKNGEAVFRQEFNDITEVDLYEVEKISQFEGRYEVTDKEKGLILSKDSDYYIMDTLENEFNIIDMNVEIPFPFNESELNRIAESIHHYGINENSLPYHETDIPESEIRKEHINDIVSGLKSKNTDIIDGYETQIIDAYLRIHDKLEKSSPENNTEYHELKTAEKEADYAAQAVHRLSEIEWSNREREGFRKAAENAEHKFTNMGEKEKENFIKRFESQKFFDKLHAKHEEKMLYKMIIKEDHSKRDRQKETEILEREAETPVLSYCTLNLGGTGVNEDTEPVVYNDFRSALDAYIDVEWIGRKSIGYLTPDNKEYVELAYYDNIDETNHISEVYTQILFPFKESDKNEQFLDNMKILSSELNRDSAKSQITSFYIGAVMNAAGNIVRQNSEEGRWQYRIANNRRPQDYVQLNIEGNQRNHEIVFTANIIHANEFEESISFSSKTNADNLEESVRNAYVGACRDFTPHLEAVIEKLDTDIEYPFTLYADYMEDTLEKHEDKLNALGYESEPSYELYNLNKDTKEEMIETNMGKMPVKDYLDIKAQQYGFDSYEDLKAEGLSISIPKEEQKEGQKEGQKEEQKNKETTARNKRKFLQGKSR